MTWNVPLAKRHLKLRPEIYTYPFVTWVVVGTVVVVAALATAGAAYVAWISFH